MLTDHRAASTDLSIVQFRLTHGVHSGWYAGIDSGIQSAGKSTAWERHAFAKAPSPTLHSFCVDSGFKPLRSLTCPCPDGVNPLKTGTSKTVQRTGTVEVPFLCRPSRFKMLSQSRLKSSRDRRQHGQAMGRSRSRSRDRGYRRDSRDRGGYRDRSPPRRGGGGGGGDRGRDRDEACSLLVRNLSDRVDSRGQKMRAQRTLLLRTLCCADSFCFQSWRCLALRCVVAQICATSLIVMVACGTFTSRPTSTPSESLAPKRAGV